MKVLVSGMSGLIGAALALALRAAGHAAIGLSRSREGGEWIRWDPDAGQLDAARLEGFEAVVHLAGEGIADRRWSAAQKERIRNSRVNSTRLLAEKLASLSQPPPVFVCASAIGYYGDRGDEELTEQSPSGDGFLAGVCREWEAAADAARNKGIRVAHMRTGVVLSAAGGALAKMLTPFKLCLGGVVGSGKQYMSWITLDDEVGAIMHAIAHADLAGPVNGVAPAPVTNREFTKTLGKVLGRPTVFPMPAFAARLAFGKMADELLLASAKVLPKRLNESGYAFGHPQLEGALRHVLGRSA